MVFFKGHNSVVRKTWNANLFLGKLFQTRSVRKLREMVIYAGNKDVSRTFSVNIEFLLGNLNQVTFFKGHNPVMCRLWNANFFVKLVLKMVFPKND